jgi:myosin-5
MAQCEAKCANGENNACLAFDRIDKLAFTVRHYAGPVRYSATLFLEKNIDAVTPSIVDLLMNCDNFLVKALAQNHMNADNSNSNSRNNTKRGVLTRQASSSGSSLASLTVGSRFKNQLSVLMQTIERTSQQFVRCIKPNSITSASAFDTTQVLSQLKCSGVVEALHVARKGYPHKLTHSDFLARFGCLLPKTSTACGDDR